MIQYEQFMAVSDLLDYIQSKFANINWGKSIQNINSSVLNLRICIQYFLNLRRGSKSKVLTLNVQQFQRSSWISHVKWHTQLHWSHYTMLKWISKMASKSMTSSYVQHLNYFWTFNDPSRHIVSCIWIINLFITCWFLAVNILMDV